MDILQELVNTLTEEDKKEFRVFINRQKSKKQRKDLDLFELISEQIPTKSIQETLYKTPNKVAYHTLRKRLLKHRTDFIVLKQIDDDTTATSSIAGLISLSSYLFKNQSNELGWRFLLKAENSAIENEHFALLNNIYHAQLEKIGNEYAPDIDTIYNKLVANKKLIDEDERANIAYSYIKKALNESRVDGEEKDLEKIIQEILKKYDLDNVVYNRPQLLFKVLDLTRKFMFSKKDFYSFEPYVIKLYNKLTSDFGFTKSNHFYKINIQYMIAHALYRNRKFKESNTYLEQMHESMQAYNNNYYQQFSTKHTQLKAANLSYLNRNEEAINLLENIDNKTLKKMSTVDQLNSKINLCVYYVNQSFYKDANRIIQTLGHSDAWLEKKIGREWVLKKNLIDIIIQYEIGNVDITLNRLRSFRMNYANLIEHPIYKRAFYFIDLVQVLIDEPEIVSSEKFREEVSKKIGQVPAEQEDLQAMAFYCWYKSKMIKESYYDVLLDVVNELGIYPAILIG